MNLRFERSYPSNRKSSSFSTSIIQWSQYVEAFWERQENSENSYVEMITPKQWNNGMLKHKVLVLGVKRFSRSTAQEETPHKAGRRRFFEFDYERGAWLLSSRGLGVPILMLMGIGAQDPLSPSPLLDRPVLSEGFELPLPEFSIHKRAGICAYQTLTSALGGSADADLSNIVLDPNDVGFVFAVNILNSNVSLQHGFAQFLIRGAPIFRSLLVDGLYT